MEKEAEKEAGGKKKGAEGEGEGVAETLLEQRGDGDPDTRDNADYAVRAFVTECMLNFCNTMADVADIVRAALEADPDGRSVFNQEGFLSFLGDQLLRDVATLGHGPVMVGLIHELSCQVDEAMKQATLDTFITSAIAEGGACSSWYVRDNIAFLAGDKWASLVKLAVEDDDFRGGLHKLGLPSMFLEANKLAQPLVSSAAAYKKTALRQKQEVSTEEDSSKANEKAAEKEATQDQAKALKDHSAAI